MFQIVIFFNHKQLHFDKIDIGKKIIFFLLIKNVENNCGLKWGESYLGH